MTFMTKQRTFLSIFKASVLMGAALPLAAQADDLVLSGAVSVENRYVTEGVNNEPDADALLFSEVALETMGFTAGVVYVQALSGSSYNEIDLFLEYGMEFGDLETYVGIQFLTFPAPDEEDTWEVYAGFEWAVLPLLNLYGEFYYDFDEVDGGFIELGVSTEIPQPVEELSLEPYVQLGVDYGFLRENRRLRENNLQIGLVATFDLTDNLALFGSLNHSFALDNLDQLEEGDVTWGGAGLAFSF